jgi:hypothetical protein
MPLSFAGVEIPDMPVFSSFGSGVIVDAEGDRENVFARGPRWVSLSSEVIVSTSGFGDQWVLVF